jgi:hypothetical protein
MHTCQEAECQKSEAPPHGISNSAQRSGQLTERKIAAVQEREGKEEGNELIEESILWRSFVSCV